MDKKMDPGTYRKLENISMEAWTAFESTGKVADYLTYIQSVNGPNILSAEVEMNAIENKRDHPEAT